MIWPSLCLLLGSGLCALLGFAAPKPAPTRYAAPESINPLAQRPIGVPLASVAIRHRYPHDPHAFTEGLLYQHGFLWESTGLLGQSSLRKVRLADGRILSQRRLPTAYFGEGLALFRSRLYQLTWRNHTGLIYDPRTLQQVGRFSYAGEGWGLTQNGHDLIMSNGSNVLQFLDPRQMRVTRRLHVMLRGKPLNNLNELEYVNQEIWANVWLSDYIARIDPDSGQVRSLVDLGPLRASLPPQARVDVLNGIAFDPKRQRLFLTGKWWPDVFEVILRHEPASARPGQSSSAGAVRSPSGTSSLARPDGLPTGHQ